MAMADPRCSATIRSAIVPPPFVIGAMPHAPKELVRTSRHEKASPLKLTSEEPEHHQGVHARCQGTGDGEQDKSDVADVVDRYSSVKLGQRSDDYRSSSKAEKVDGDHESCQRDIAGVESG